MQTPVLKLQHPFPLQFPGQGTVASNILITIFNCVFYFFLPLQTAGKEEGAAPCKASKVG